MTQWACARVGSTSGRRGNVMESGALRRGGGRGSHMLYTRVLTAIYSEITQGQDTGRPCGCIAESGRATIAPPECLTIAGLSGFLTLIQSLDGPDLYGAVSRFDTIPSKPIVQACRYTVAPSSSVCALSSIPGGPRARSLARSALRSRRASPVAYPRR
jgi:hypothetical protein